METKNALMLGGIRRIPGSCHEAVRVTKKKTHFAPLPGRLEDPGLVARDLLGTQSASWLVPTFPREVPSLILW